MKSCIGEISSKSSFRPSRKNQSYERCWISMRSGSGTASWSVVKYRRSSCWGIKRRRATLPVSWAARGSYDASFFSVWKFVLRDRQNARRLRKIRIVWLPDTIPVVLKSCQVQTATLLPIKNRVWFLRFLQDLCVFTQLNTFIITKLSTEAEIWRIQRSPQRSKWPSWTFRPPLKVGR